MRTSRRFLAAIGSVVVLAALASSATAGRLSISELNLTATWTRINFSGGLGTWECEVTLASRLHARTITKTAGSLVGYITAGNVNRCSRGGATVLRETLPWHMQYAGFAGALPNISSIATRIIGFSYRIREPTFGITCLFVSEEEEPAIVGYNLTGGVVASTSLGGEIETSCGVGGTLSGTSRIVSPNNVTISLI